MKTKINPKYAKLLKYADCDDTRYKNLCFIDDNTKSVISCNKARMLAVRSVYNETKVLSRVLGSNALEYNYKDNIFVATNCDIPGYKSIIPSQEVLDGNDYIRIRITIPDWIKGISIRTKQPFVSFIFGDKPLLALNNDHENGICIDASFLKPFAGETIDVYAPKNVAIRKPFTFMPEGCKIDTAPWFSLVMPLNLQKRNRIEYF